MFAQPTNPNCPVKMYKSYIEHMPEDIRNEKSQRFYLRPLQNPKTDVWYSHAPLGKNTIGKMMKTMANLGELEGRKTNHSTRKTFATTLLDADLPNTDVAQLGGWKSVQTLNEYAAPNLKKQKTASDILSHTFLPKVDEVDVNTNSSEINIEESNCHDAEDKIENENSSQITAEFFHDNNNNPIQKVAESMSSSQSNTMTVAQKKESNPFSLFCGATINGGVINLNIFRAGGKRPNDDNI